jgi:hypothetical protein
VDECGALSEWLARAPNARPACGQVGALVNITEHHEGSLERQQ